MGQRAAGKILVACIAALLLWPAAAPAGAEAKASSPTAQQIKRLKKKAIKKVTAAVSNELGIGSTPELEQPSTPPLIKVVSCKQRKRKGEFAGFQCAWNAHGELPGIVPFKCKGGARVDAKAKKVKKLDPCENGEDPQAPLLAAPRDVSFAYIEDFLTYPDLFDELGASGADSVEHQIAWDVVEPNPGDRNWSAYDGLYNQSLAVGARPVWVLLDAPCWASPPGACDPANAINAIDGSKVADYARIAAEIAQRYPQSRAIEVWFEPNGPLWGTSPNPALFSRLVGATADAVHATGTGVPVYAGGLAPGSADPAKQEFGSFLADALDAGGIEKADDIGFHAVADVPFKPGDDPTDGYLGRIRIQIAELNSKLAAHGLSTPIAITELAYSTAGPNPYTEDQQAEALVSSYELLRRLPGIPIVIVSSLLDQGDGSKVAGFGVLRANRSKKPAYCELAAARGVPTPAGC